MTDLDLFKHQMRWALLRLRGAYPDMELVRIECGATDITGYADKEVRFKAYVHGNGETDYSDYGDTPEAAVDELIARARTRANPAEVGHA